MIKNHKNHISSLNRLHAVKACIFSGMLFCTLCLIPALFSSCRNDPKDIARIKIPDTISGQFITDGEIFYSELGHVKVRIESPEINNYETTQSYTEMPKGFYAEFFNDNLKAETTISAEYGILLNKENIMRARRNVIVHSLKDNEQLNTEELIWNMNTKKIYTEAFVKLTSNDKILYGDGFEADENFENRSITKLRGEIHVQKEKVKPPAYSTDVRP